jgi:hypothetical protein
MPRSQEEIEISYHLTLFAWIGPGFDVAVAFSYVIPDAAGVAMNFIH